MTVARMSTVTAAPARLALTLRLAAVAGRLLAALSLLVSGYVHLDLAGRYAAIAGSVLNEQELFLAQGALAIVLAVLVLARPGRVVLAGALLLSAASLAAILTYRYINVGALGPFPDMYEPAWYFEKTLSAFADGLTAVFALVALSLGGWRAASASESAPGRHPARPSSAQRP